MKTTGFIRLQEQLREKTILEDRLPEKIKTVGGADQAFPAEDLIRSCVVVLSFPGLEEIERKTTEKKADFPYIPGLLTFREGPSIKAAYHKLEQKPDLLLVDGQGIAHPRRMGLATHVGIDLDVPTIGIAKKRLVGVYSPPEEEGDASLLRDKGDIVGFAYKSKKGCRPLFVSPGHKVSLHTSLSLVRDCMRKHKLPEPARLAHQCANER